MEIIALRRRGRLFAMRTGEIVQYIYSHRDLTETIRVSLLSRSLDDSI